MQNAFFGSLASNGAKYYISGHDHVDQRSIITSPDGASQVQQIIGASNSSKFYTPKALTDAKWYGQKTRETSVAQDLYTVGYYIYTVDGPRVTVDYYADDHGNWKSDANYPNGAGLADTGVTPTFHFVKKQTWGYSLNGKEFLVGGGPTNGTNNSPDYSVVQDNFGGTTAKILGGTYANTATDFTGRTLTQAVDTGWTRAGEESGLASDILTLWGMKNVGAAATDEYVLSLSFDAGKGKHDGFSNLGVLASKNAKGRWVKAVDLNVGGGATRFVVGPWQPQDTLGTYGVDPATNTAWAVINYNASFAVDRGLDLVPLH
jgi:hypothetical protein